MRRTKLLYIGLVIVTLSSIGCNLKRNVINYVPTRVAREFFGEKTNVHPIVPITAEVRKYRVIAVKNLDNLMLDEIPTEMYNLLNDQIAEQITRRKIFKEVTRIETEAELPTKHDAPPTLVLDGFVDNYHAGSRGLRLAEVGLNHAVVTIRLRLRDWSSNKTVGSVSITVYERAASKSVKSAIHKVAKEAADFIQKGATVETKSHG
jgi:hypothetical protein